MATGVGVLGGFTGLGEEGTYGTAVAATRFLYHNSESLRVQENKVFSGAVYKVGRNAARQVQSTIGVSGDFSFNPSHSAHAWTMLLKHLLGSVSSSQPDSTSAPTVYRHTFTPADALPTGLTLEIGKDVLANRFLGCKVVSMRVSGAAGQLMDASVGLLGRDSTSITPSAPVLTEANLIVLTNTAITWNSGTINVVDFDIAIENALAPRYFVNSRLTSEPLRSGKRRVSGSFRVELTDATMWSDFRNATRRDLIITCTGATITGAYAFETKFTLPVNELQEAQAHADTEGVLTIPCSFESFYDSTNANEITVRVTNENSSAV